MPAARRPEIYGYLTPVTGLPAEELPTQTMQAYLDAVGAAVLPLNVGMLVGGGTVRAAAAGFSPEPLDSGALHAVHRLIEQSLSGGALGVSLGLAMRRRSSIRHSSSLTRWRRCVKAACPSLSTCGRRARGWWRRWRR